MWPLDQSIKTKPPIPTISEIASAPAPGTQLPDTIKGWNWGAFWLTWIWGIRNRVWISLFALIPVVGIVIAFVLGAYGTEWAWETGRWTSVEAFRRSQRRWSIAGFIGFALVLALTIVGVLAGGGTATTADTTAGTLPMPVLAKGGSFDVAGTGIVCRAGTGATVVVECGPVRAGGAPEHAGLRGRISSSSIAVVRGRPAHAVTAFMRRQPRSGLPALVVGTPEAPHLSLAADESLAVAGSNILCAAMDEGSVKGVACAESGDPLGNEIVPGHFALVVATGLVAVTRIISPSGDQTVVFERAQPRVTAASA